jgi:hypothetical protein
VTIIVNGWNGNDFRANDARNYEWHDGRWLLRAAPQPAH